MSALQLTQADHGKTIPATVGTPVAISLAENPATGFRWAVDQADPQAIELKSSDYASPHNAGIGGGGTRTMLFELKKNGALHLMLKLWRDWEGDASISQRFACTFDIR